MGIEDKFKSSTSTAHPKDAFHADPGIKEIGRIKHELRKAKAQTKKAAKRVSSEVKPPERKGELRRGGANYRLAAPTSQTNASGFEVKMPKGVEAYHAVRERAALDFAESLSDPSLKSFAGKLASEHGDSARRARGGGGGGSAGGGGGSGQRRHPKGVSSGGRFMKK